MAGRVRKNCETGVDTGSDRFLTFPLTERKSIMTPPAKPKPTVAVIGASRDRRKYGNKSVRAHLQQGYEVFPINPHAVEIEEVAAFSSLADVPRERLDRVTMYLPPEIGVTLLDDIAAKSPGEVWLNPGSESDRILRLADQLGLNVIQACSIVDLGESPASFG